MPVGLHPVAFWAAAQAGVCMEGGSDLPQGVVAPCGADQCDAKGQDGCRVAGGRQVLRALRRLACSASFRVGGVLSAILSEGLLCQRSSSCSATGDTCSADTPCPPSFQYPLWNMTMFTSMAGLGHQRQLADTNKVRLKDFDELLFAEHCEPNSNDGCRADLLLQQQWADILGCHWEPRWQPCP